MTLVRQLGFWMALSVTAVSAAEPLMLERGEVLLDETFEPESVNENWFYRGEFALRDGALVRTEVNAKQLNQRYFK